MTEIITKLQAYGDGEDVLFFSMTGRKSWYRLPADKQSNKLITLIRTIVLPFCLSIYGVIELTVKGNAHVHCFLKPNLLYWSDNEIPLSMVNFIKLFNGILKATLPIFDIQIPRNIEKVCSYMIKDVEITRKAIKRTPMFKMTNSFAKLKDDEMVEASEVTRMQTQLLDFLMDASE